MLLGGSRHVGIENRFMQETFGFPLPVSCTCTVREWFAVIGKWSSVGHAESNLNQLNLRHANVARAVGEPGTPGRHLVRKSRRRLLMARYQI